MAKVLTEQPSCFQIILCGVDWPQYVKSIPGHRKSSRMSVIRAEFNDSDSQTSSSESLAQQIMLEKDPETRGELVTEYAVMVINEWAGISSNSETDLNKSLYSYGIDSAGALTLKMQLESILPVSFEVGCLLKSLFYRLINIHFLSYSISSMSDRQLTRVNKLINKRILQQTKKRIHICCLGDTSKSPKKHFKKYIATSTRGCDICIVRLKS